MGELNVAEVLVGVEIAEKLQSEEGTHVIMISRVILTDGRPVAYLEDYLPPDVLTEETENRVYRISAGFSIETRRRKIDQVVY